MGKPDYAKWIRKPLWFLVDAAQLLADREPIHPPLSFIPLCERGEAGVAGSIYNDLKSAITLHDLSFHKSRTGHLGTRLVEPVECVVWAQKHGMEVPEPLRVLTESSVSFHKPDWKHWNACDLLEVWEAVALSLDREPKSIQDNRKRLTRPGREIKLFDGGPDFDRRLDLLRRAFELQASQFTPADDIYGGFDLFEERNVLPAKVRQFFINKGLAVPAEWVAPATIETEDRQAAPPQPSPAPTDEWWKPRARELFSEMAAGSSLSKEQLADKIAEQLHKEGITGRGGKRLKGPTILRGALQNIPKP